VFGPEGRASRLRYVLATWGFVCSGWWGTGCGLIATNATLSYGDVAAKADVLAIPGYFDCGLGQAPAQEALVSLESLGSFLLDLNTSVLLSCVIVRDTQTVPPVV
jgi:hypothetical protein